MRSIEIYTLEGCPYCTRLKGLLDSKDVSYNEIVIDSDGNSRDKMAERTQGRTSVPQVLVDGEYLGGYDEVLDLEAKGELNAVLGIKSTKEAPDKLWDLVVIGAGPAGLSAGIYATRKRLSCLVIGKELGGQVGETSVVENYLGTISSTGAELIESYRDHAEAVGVELMLGEEVIEFNLDTGCKEILTKSGKAIKSRTLIIASGAKKRKLGLEGEERLAGRGVAYCAICEGPQLAGNPVVVIGGGNSGLEAALSMVNLDSEVSLVEMTDQLGGDTVLRENVLNSDKINVYTSYKVREIKGDEEVKGVIIENLQDGTTQELNAKGVFVMAGLLPNSSFALDIASANDKGEIHINERNETGVPGVFAAGDVTTIQYKQILIAAGEGAKAALVASEYLSKKR